MNPTDDKSRRNTPFASPDQPTQIDDTLGASDSESGRFAPGQRLGPYRIDRLLGEGGMGAVYLAEQLEPVQRPVALKLIRGQLRGGLAEAYFLVERQALARMDHPAIAKVYDAGTTPQGFPYFAMEWIDGPTLAAHCDASTPSLSEMLTLFIRIARGAHHAHQKGVIHRDLKPSNVLIASVDGEPFPKIIDFGVAVGASNNSGGTGTALMYSAGTRGYMSPEQLAGVAREIDIRTDIYALGVMLLEVLAPPSVLDLAVESDLDNRDLHAAVLASLGQHVHANEAIARELSTIPFELRWVIATAMQPERKDRYESAEAFAGDLESYLENRPLNCVPATRVYQLRKFVARNRSVIVAAALIFVALLAGTAAAIYGMLQARAAAERARIEAQKSQATSKFMSDILSSVRPEEARDLDKALMHKILTNADERARTELADQPEVLADIEGTIGNSYSSLSETKHGLELTQHAYDLSLGAVGADSLLTLRLERQLANQMFIVGKQKEGCAMTERNLASFKRVAGDEDKDTLRAGLNAIECDSALGNNEQADKRIKALMPTIERIAGKDNVMTLDALTIQAYILDYLGRYDEGEAVFKDTVERETRVLGPEHPKTLDTLNNFAILYLESHRFAEGEKILAAMLPICEKIYGPDHAFTIEIVSNLGGALRQQATPEKIAASGPYYKRTYDSMLKKYGEKHPNVIRSRHNYANYLLDVGDVEQAVAFQKQCVAESKDVFGVDHQVTGEAEFGLGKAQLRAGNYAESEQALLAAVENKQKTFPPDHWRLDEYMAPLVDLYTAWNKPEKVAEWKAKRAALEAKPANAA